MSKFADNIWFTTIHCYKCGIPFAVTTEFDEERLKRRDSFYCPAGHGQVYTGKSEAQKLREELDRQKQITDAASARASKAEFEAVQVSKAHKKMRDRIVNGVCPCCNRTFQNLLMHMRSEHPEMTAPKTLAALRESFGMGQAAVAKEAGVQTAYVSLYERDKPMPAYAKSRLDSWVERHNTEKQP